MFFQLRPPLNTFHKNNLGAEEANVASAKQETYRLSFPLRREVFGHLWPGQKGELNPESSPREGTYAIAAKHSWVWQNDLENLNDLI